MTTPNNPLIEMLEEEANQVAADPSPNRVTLLYGDFGKRKTTTACSMVQNRGLLLSTDSSWKVLLNERHRDLYPSKITPITLTGLSQIKLIDFGGYDTIIWDTVSRSVDGFLDLLYDEASWSGTNLRQKINTTNKELKDVEVLAAMDYRVTRDFFRPVLNHVFRQDAHIIFTSQHKEPMKGLSVNMTIRPDIPAATLKVIAEQADLIVNLRSEGSKFVADLTENSMSYLAKSRIQGLQGKMNLDDFVKKYKEIVFK